MRAVVTGSRDANDQEKIHKAMDRIHKKYGPIIFLGEGGARGVDTICGLWAWKHGIALAVMNANWDYYFKKAGPIRNGWMLDFLNPEYLIAFPGRTGTNNCMEQADKRGIPIIHAYDH